MDSARAGTSKDEEDDEVVEEPAKKVFKTLTGSSAILDLKNELLKKKSEYAAAGVKGPSGNKGVLYVKKDEKSRLKTEADERKARISEHEQALRREAAEQIELVNRRLKEKAELYEKLQNSGVALEDDIGEGLIDFNAKKRDADREKEREKERERQRREEEEEEQSQAEAIHHVAGEEPRMYGASHVIFSKNEEKRQKEMSDLVKMTAQTDKNRDKTKTLAEKREESRKAKERALREKLGLPPLPEAEPEEPEVGVDPTISSIPLPEPPKEEKPRPTPKEREWDRGKGSVNNWVRSRREERDEDFAPPSFY
ncbi:hypothetical protein PENTCL1PPCAC_22429 [Pristionchus entomophagus]|uniref:Uncharacterized protein n=1 Tax=Pristionchus entomophagus TaxID=358040 RepID=A0AAV5U243_9BILA|nr:hypothetical protein PENTCL1PPCAC_22429 [Pristionchus entomophagus]